MTDHAVSRTLAPLLKPARYKGAYGGRGSGKSHFFAEMMVAKCASEPGSRAVCVREVQKTLAQSSKALIEDKIREHYADAGFEPRRDEIQTPGGGVIMFQGMQDHTAESIKSLWGCKWCWVEEAHMLTERSLTLLRPTIRVPNSEIWFSWNPTRESDAVDVFMRQKNLEEAISVQCNWRDNPWWNDVLEYERRTDEREYSDLYPHVWEGEYAQAWSGAYYAKQLTEAKISGRIGNVAPDPLIRKRAYWDIGGAGAKADANAIWICQFVDREIRVLDYIEGVGQVLAYYAGELRSRGHGEALCILPHDGVNTNSFTGKRYEDHLRDAGFSVDVVPNQGPGAAMMRIEASRRLFPRIWFNGSTTEAGRRALGFYHEKRDALRGVGLGPEHDWSSNAGDSFGLMCVAYEEPRKVIEKRQFPRSGGGWQAA